MISNLFKEHVGNSFCFFRRWIPFQSHLHNFRQDTNPKAINNFQLYLEKTMLVLLHRPQQILHLPSHGCVGLLNFTRHLWRLSANLVEVKVCPSLFQSPKHGLNWLNFCLNYFYFFFSYRSYP